MSTSLLPETGSRRALSISASSFPVLALRSSAVKVCRAPPEDPPASGVVPAGAEPVAAEGGRGFLLGPAPSPLPARFMAGSAADGAGFAAVRPLISRISASVE